ncbi:MAG: sugar phosphate isomerase/epimerase [Treponema sp.]|jgi:sugar phosphate isomerase/epimerase|nr:sugar phosphate isomerase/epimerase [Treponema sp.]
MQTGVVLGYGENTERNFTWCVENGITTCQLYVPAAQYHADGIEKIKSLCSKTGMEITALVGHGSGPTIYDFYGGPLTIGIVPAAWQASRTQDLASSAEFAARLGVPRVCGHMGFIPENPNDPAYTACIAAARWLAGVYARNGVGLDFETGQETPITMLRAIRDIDSPCIGVNFDPANLLMYGKANPVDALDILGPYVRGFHAKDGEYPVDPGRLGPEKPLGEGRVDFPALIKKLLAAGYDGPLTIEREIEGEEQRSDILKAKRILDRIINEH